MRKALTFDDVLLVPKKGVLKSRREAKLNTRLTKKIEIKIPIVSASMDTVTEWKMAVALAREGAMGIIHRFMSIERQAEQIRKVKRAENLVIERPYVVGEEESIEEVIEKQKRLNVSGFPVVREGKLVGIITNRDIKYADRKEKVKDVMTRDVVTLSPPFSREKAIELLRKHKIEKLPIVDEDNNLLGLVTAKDLISTDGKALKDKKGRLMVGAAVGVKDTLKRVEALLKEEVDVISIDVAHGHSEMVEKAVKEIKKHFDVQVIAGNVATKQGTEDLISSGADAVKVGVGPGATCITRIVTGHGVPQLTAIMDSYEIAKSHDVPIIADGGIRNSGDIVKAIAAGASSVMIGSLLAGTEESPGIVIMRNGRKYKLFRGMASSWANVEKLKEEGVDVEEFTSYTAEGVEGLVEYKGKVSEILRQLVGGIRSGISYAGKRSVKELIGKGDFVEISYAGLKESKPHDINQL